MKCCQAFWQIWLPSVIVWLYLFEMILLLSLVLSVKSFIFSYTFKIKTVKMMFLDFFRRFEQSFRWCLYSDQFPMLLSLLKLSFNLGLFVAVLRWDFDIQGWILFLTTFSFRGANWLNKCKVKWFKTWHWK